ncbi:hypothetical protein [Eubacterium barkeri]|uniref:Uncharacterized protein n=1 Tax=Eubacterium barkeri TaxID=1528 RepID=A0A1H3I1V6_EUBBA|nr:hypothetical protein [Eubacterium barkeri]SDY21691.1 hypothetical protein SAMN04488579_12052 [Eubacterium barkeri]
MSNRLQELGQRMGEGFAAFKESVEAKLSAENAMTPEQRIRNAEAELAGRRAAESSAMRKLEDCRDESEKYKRYAEEADASGDGKALRRYESALADLAAKLPQLEKDYQDAAVRREACEEIIAGLGLNAQQNEV